MPSVSNLPMCMLQEILKYDNSYFAVSIFVTVKSYNSYNNLKRDEHREQ